MEQKSLVDRMTALEKRQDKDDADKRRDFWLKVIPIVVSALALLASAYSGRASSKNSEISQQELELKLKESSLSLKLTDITTPLRRVVLTEAELKKTSPSLKFRIVNNGAPVTIEDVEIEYSVPFDLFKGMTKQQIDDMIVILKETEKGNMKQAIDSAPKEAMRIQRLLWVAKAPKELVDPCPLPRKLEPNDGFFVHMTLEHEWESAVVSVYTTAGKKFEFAIP